MVLYGSGAYGVAAVLVAVSGLTDIADGFIARKFHMITEWGKIVDPFADKLTQGALIACLLFRYSGMWLLVGIFLVKETAMFVAGVRSVRGGRSRLSGALWFGKASTVVQFVSMTALLAFPTMPEWLANVFILLCAAFMLLAFVLYMREYVRLDRLDKAKKLEK